ncbi:MAG TPA: ATP-binding cassette domain-containing protein [Firmicutes bacterium]|nr:ATP-binding cassette domain-containing protein [Bacillota bacterium]
MLRISQLRKVFSNGSGVEMTALDNVNLDVRPGDFITIIGSNGAGKSTLLNVIAGVYEVDEGEIWIDGENVTNQPEYRRAHLIGRVFQDPMIGTAASMTIEENLAMAMKRAKRLRLVPGVTAKDRARFRELLAVLGLGLENRLQEPVGLLSGGQRQALTLLMATISNPKLLLLDEHTAALDPKTAEMICQLTKRIVENRELTVLMVTHDLKQALELGNRTIMMDQGQIILDLQDPERADMTVDELLDQFEAVRGKRLLDDRVLLV